MKYIILGIATFLFIYLMISFALWNFDASQWGENVRWGFVLFGAWASLSVPFIVKQAE